MTLTSILILASPIQTSSAAEPTRTNLPNPFFAMNFWQLDPKISSSPDAQAKLLKELGYDGMLYLGALDGINESFRALDSQGLEMSAAAVIPYDIPIDPGETYPASLKEAIKQLKGRKTLLLIQFQSKLLPKSSPEGDARAVELGRELADFAREYGVRLAIYPHVNIWCERIDHAVRIAKKCGRENLGVSFNLTHWLWTDPHGNLNSLVRDAMPHLFLVTVNGINKTAPLGVIETLDRGDHDVAGFLKPFIVAGYHGPIGLQCVGIKGDVRDNLTRSMAAWRRISARLATGSSESSETSPRIIEVDFSQVVGTIRPLHGVNCGPIAEGFSLDLSRYFRALLIPCVRLMVPNNPRQDCVHIQYIFPDMTADPDDPANYHFRRTDDYIAAVLAVGAKPIYNLGLGREKDTLASDHRESSIPPTDIQKWSRVCVNIARHYNQGWAGGFRHHLQYWEIWNEPDAKAFWTGTLDQYVELYAAVAMALKQYDQQLKVGGPALSHNLKFLEGFLTRCQERKLPLDFCSWHCYDKDPVTMLKRSKEVQRLLEQYGFAKAENHLNEWNSGTTFRIKNDPFRQRELFERMGSSEGGAFHVSVLSFLQDSPVTLSAFYGGDTFSYGFIDRNGAPKTCYFALLAFRYMLDTPRRVIAKGDDFEKGFAVLAGLAENNSRAGILISNYRLDCGEYEIRIRGLPWRNGTDCTRFVVDQHTPINQYELNPIATNRLSAGDTVRITIPAATPSVSLLELTDARGKQTEPTSIQTK